MLMSVKQNNHLDWQSIKSSNLNWAKLKRRKKLLLS